MISIRSSSTVVERCLNSAGVQRDNAICIARLPNFLHEKRGFSIERYEIVGANKCLFDAMRKSMNGISFDWQHGENTKVNTNSMWKNSLTSIGRTSYNKILRRGIERRTRHALTHDELLQMGSYGTQGALYSTKYMKYIDVGLFAVVSVPIGCKRHLACLGCAGSSRTLALKVLQKAAQQT